MVISSVLTYKVRATESIEAQRLLWQLLQCEKVKGAASLILWVSFQELIVSCHVLLQEVITSFPTYKFRAIGSMKGKRLSRQSSASDSEGEGGTNARGGILAAGTPLERPVAAEDAVGKWCLCLLFCGKSFAAVHRQEPCLNPSPVSFQVPPFESGTICDSRNHRCFSNQSSAVRPGVCALKPALMPPLYVFRRLTW
jgi:hypothetical protein